MSEQIAKLMTLRPVALTDAAHQFGSVSEVVALQPQLHAPVKAKLADQRGAVVTNAASVLNGQLSAQEPLRDFARTVAQRTAGYSAGITRCQAATAQILNAARSQGLGVTGDGRVIAFDRTRTVLAAQYTKLLQSACTAAQTFDRSTAAQIRAAQQTLVHTVTQRTTGSTAAARQPATLFPATLTPATPHPATLHPATLLNPAGFADVTRPKDPGTVNAISASASPSSGREGFGPADPQAPSSATVEVGGTDTRFHVTVGPDNLTGGGVSQTFRDGSGKPSGQLGLSYESEALSVDYSSAGKVFHAAGTYHLDTHQVEATLGGSTGNLSVEGSVQFNPDTSQFESGKVSAKLTF